MNEIKGTTTPENVKIKEPIKHLIRRSSRRDYMGILLSLKSYS